MLTAIKNDTELWDLFTKKEEYGATQLDEHGRFSYRFSRLRDVYAARVSEFLVRNGLNPEYPNGENFALCLTHDIDALRFSARRTIYEAVRSLGRGHVAAASNMLLSRLSKKHNPLWNFDKIMKLEEQYNAKSSFYFLALERNDVDFRYDLSEVEDELRTIVDQGWEVGLHGGLEAYDNLQQLKREKQALEEAVGKKVIGYRNHYLKFKVPTTWQLLREAGFAYDTTFGYADCAGFRNGLCHPFYPFDLTANKWIDVLEIPLTIMDCTLSVYMGLDWKSMWDLAKHLIDTVQRQRGVITVLWHNEYMIGPMLDFYEDILRYCRSRNAWMTSGEKIWRWWEKTVAKKAGVHHESICH